MSRLVASSLPTTLILFLKTLRGFLHSITLIYICTCPLFFYFFFFNLSLLVETVATSVPSRLLLEYEVLIARGKRLTEAATARLPGGLALRVKKQSSAAERVNVEYGNMFDLILWPDYSK